MIWLIVITPLISRIGFSIRVQWLVPINALIAQPPADILRTLIHHHFFLLLIKIYIFCCINIAEAFVLEAGFFHCLCVSGPHQLQGTHWDHRLVNSISGIPFKLDPLLVHSVNISKKDNHMPITVLSARTEEREEYQDEWPGCRNLVISRGDTHGTPWNTGKLPWTRNNVNGALRTRQLALISNK